MCLRGPVFHSSLRNLKQKHVTSIRAKHAPAPVVAPMMTSVRSRDEWPDDGGSWEGGKEDGESRGCALLDVGTKPFFVLIDDVALLATRKRQRA